MPKKADAYIIPRPRPDDTVEYIIRPTFAVVADPGQQKGPWFVIRNLTGIENTVVDLQGEEDTSARDDPPRRQRTGSYDVFEIKIKRREGFFAYKVTVGGVPAKGESDPVIIIDPPAN